MLANRNEWWVPGKIVEVRHRLKGYWQVRLVRAFCVEGFVGTCTLVSRWYCSGFSGRVGRAWGSL